MKPFGHTRSAPAATLSLMLATAALILTFFVCLSSASATVPGKNGDLLLNYAPPAEPGKVSNRQVVVANPTNPVFKSLTPSVEGFSENGVFSPDGRSIAFGSWRLDGAEDQRGVFRLNLENLSKQFMWETPTDAPAYYGPISYAPSGNALMLTGFSTDCATRECDSFVELPGNGIYVRNLKTSTTSMLEIDDPDVNPVQAVYSPDGKRIFIVSVDNPKVSMSGYSIYVARSNGGSAHRIFQTDNEIWDISSSPDGARVAIAIAEFNIDRHRTNIFTIGTDSKGLKRITDDDVSTNPVFSPDGKSIAMTKDLQRPDRPERERDIWIVGADGSGARSVIARDGDEVVRDWSRSVPFEFHRFKKTKSLAVVRTFGPGKVSVHGKLIAARARTTKSGGIVRVPVMPKKNVRLAGGTTVTIKVRFAPKGGLPSSIVQKVKLGGRNARR